MLKILLCDDDPFFLSLEQQRLEEMIQREQLAALVVCAAASGQAALTFLKNNPGVDLAFLDLDFGQGMPNGIDLAAMLRRRAEGLRIVFITNHQEKAMEVLKSGVQPYGFVEKGSDIRQFAAGLRRNVHMSLGNCRTDREQEQRVRLLVGGGDTVELALGDILYLEAEKGVSHGITYHTVNGSAVTVTGSLEAEEKRLGEGFWRVHRSFLAARNKILDLKDGYLVLSNQGEIPCSFRMRPEVKKWLRQPSGDGR